MTQEEKTAYATEVWQTFLAKAGKPTTTMMSPADFWCLKAWLDRYPLRVVLEAMEQVKGKPETLRYYEKAVETEGRRVQRMLMA
jgi:hypothetical protein